MNKLKIFPISDLHLEFYKKSSTLFNILKPSLRQADVLVLAGDIGYACIPKENKNKHIYKSYRKNYCELLSLLKNEYKYIVLVAGNHEYYLTENYNIQETLQALKEICDETGVIFLEKSSVTIEGVKFMGTTLWSLIDSEACICLSDFNKQIFYSKIEYIEEFIDSYRWLKKELKNDPNSKKIIITHHIPTNRLIHEKYLNHRANSAFVTDILHKLILKNTPLWICGHSHEFMSITYGETKLVLNPYGYPNEQLSKSNPLSSIIYEI